MSATRTAARVALPVLTAAALLSPGSGAGRSPATAPAPGGPTVVGDVVRGTPVDTGGQGVVATVPLVTFQQHVLRSGSRLRTAVFVSSAGSPGWASVAGTTCRTPTRVGAVSWMTCPDTGARSYVVTVGLDDGRSVRATLSPTDG